MTLSIIKKRNKTIGFSFLFFISAIWLSTANTRFTFILPPENDDCTGAIELLVNPDYSCEETTTSSLIGASPYTAAPNGCTGTPENATDDVWFKFKATNISHKVEISNIFGNYTDLYHMIYNGGVLGDCSSMTPILCSDSDYCNLNAQTTGADLVVGNTYFIRVFSKSTRKDANTSFKICVGSPALPQETKDAIVLELNTRRKKGQFFASWGWNRASYSTSDITFEGNDFDFVIRNVKADDKPKPFGIEFLDPGGLTLPQTNLEIGYFYDDNFNIVLGYDHMKYVMRNNYKTVEISGNINVGDYDYFGNTYNFDGIYAYSQIALSEPFLTFEHTDGLNYIFMGINHFDSFNKMLKLNTNKIEVALEEGVDVGFVMPKTNTTILGNKRYDEFHIAGFGASASLGLSITFFNHFFIKTDFKYGYINMSDIRITNDSSEKAWQEFTFAESAYTFGYRFYLHK